LNTDTFQLKKGVEYIGLFSVVLFASTIFADRGLNRIAETLLILSVLLSLKALLTYEKSNKGLWIYLLIPIAFLFMTLVNHMAVISYPFLDLNHEQFSKRYLRLFYFAFIGWWIIKQPRLVWPLIACLSAAFIIEVVASGDIQKLFQRLLSGKYLVPRFPFGFSNAQHSAVFAGSLLLFYLSISPKIITMTNKYYKITALIFTLAVLLSTVFVVLVNQTRAVWLGLLITSVIAVIPWILLLSEKSKYFSRNKIATFFCSLLIGIIFAMSFNTAISSRIESTAKDIVHLSTLEIKDIPTSSMGIRLHQWNLAFELIKEKPLLGYGGATKKHLIKISTMPEAAITRFGHFHNSYLELAVAYGLGAPVVFIAILLFLLIRALKARKNGHLSIEFTCFSVSWVTFFFIVNLFESYVMYRTGYFLLMLLGGIIYGVTSKSYINRKSETPREALNAKV